MRSLAPDELPARLEEIAGLRVSVFRDYPYRYDGSPAYERDYLAGYAASRDAVVVVAEDDGVLIGASTGLPLADADAAFREPFERHGPAPEEVFYFGESVLLPPYRGRGLGHRFFDARERHAARLGYPVTAFCAVDRPERDPLRPPDYRPLDGFWRKRGYLRRGELQAVFEWKEIGDRVETPHTLTFWLRTR